MGNLTHVRYWFNPYPGTLYPPVLRLLLIFLVILLLAAIICYIINAAKKKSKKNKTIGRLASFFLSNFIIGAAIVFFEYENAYILSTRIIFLLWLVGMIVWLVMIAKKSKVIPEDLEKKQKEKELKKYIP